MKIIRVGGRFLNMEAFVAAERVDSPARTGAPDKAPYLLPRFSSPRPASVGASDWATRSLEVKLTGHAAAGVWEFLAAESIWSIADGEGGAS